MQSVLRLVLVDPRAASRDHVKRSLADMDSVWIEAECQRMDQFSTILPETAPDVALFALDADVRQMLAMVAETARLFPLCRIFVTSTDRDGALILQAMRAGAHEFLSDPVQLDELLPAIDRARQVRGAQTGNDSTESLVVAVAGAVGGVGTTTLAVNLGVTLASRPNSRVALLDLDLVLGDADVCLDLVHSYTLYDLTSNIERLDFTLLKRSLVQHGSGLWFLPHPVHPGESANVDPAALKRLVNLLRATFTHVVLDLSKGFRDTDLTALQAADVVLMVGQLDVSCLRNLARLMKTLDMLGSAGERSRLVLNRIGTRDLDITVEQAEKAVGRKAIAQIPNDWSNQVAARANGIPISIHAPKSRTTQAITNLAFELCGETRPDLKPGKRRGLFSMLVGAS